MSKYPVFQYFVLEVLPICYQDLNPKIPQLYQLQFLTLAHPKLCQGGLHDRILDRAEHQFDVFGVCTGGG